MPTLLYIRGVPGSGKITVARILEKELGWTLFWVHDLDPVARVVGSHKIPRLMDDLCSRVIRHLANQEKDIIYVRPSRDAETVRRVYSVFAGRPEYRVVQVLLTASYENLVKRVTSRDCSDQRVKTKADLDDYLNARPGWVGEDSLVINTDDLTPDGVALMIKRAVEVRRAFEP